MRPQINADERKCGSAFICVHPRFQCLSGNPVRADDKSLGGETHNVERVTLVAAFLCNELF